MAIDSPEATAGAVPLGTLTAQEELSCFARNGGANPGVLMRPVAWGGVRQGKKVVTTLLRRSGRGEDVLRADQPITRGRWARAGTDRNGVQGDPEGPSGETGLAPQAMGSPLPGQSSVRFLPALPARGSHPSRFRSARVIAEQWTILERQRRTWVRSWLNRGDASRSKCPTRRRSDGAASALTAPAPPVAASMIA